MTEVEWPVGVTPDIRAVKARISQQHQLQLTKESVVKSLKDELTSVSESETSWLHVDHDGKMMIYYNHAHFTTMCFI